MVAKSLLRLFDQPQKKKKDDNDGVPDDNDEAQEKDDAEQIDVDELLAQLRDLEAGEGRDDPDDAFNPLDTMAAEKKAAFLDDVKRVISALRKVCFLHAAIACS